MTDCGTSKRLIISHIFCFTFKLFFNNFLLYRCNIFFILSENTNIILLILRIKYNLFSILIITFIT